MAVPLSYMPGDQVMEGDMKALLPVFLMVMTCLVQGQTAAPRFAAWAAGHRTAREAELTREQLGALLATLPGQKPESITTRQGAVIALATVTKLTPSGLKVIGGSGIQLIPAQDLPEALLQSLGWAPEIAAAYKTESARQGSAATAQAQARAVGQMANDNAQHGAAMANNDLRTKIRNNELAVRLDVSQVLASGAALAYYHTFTSHVGLDGATHFTASEASTNPVYVLGLPAGTGDGAAWDGHLYYCGTHDYTTVSGASKRVAKWATSVDAAFNEVTK